MCEAVTCGGYSIFEDIRAVRDACKEILGDEELSTTPSVPGSDSTEANLVNAVACNAIFSELHYGINAVNIGSICEDPESDYYVENSCFNCEIGLQEREMGLANEESDEFFMIDYDMQSYDCVNHLLLK